MASHAPPLTLVNSTAPPLILVNPGSWRGQSFVRVLPPAECEVATHQSTPLETANRRVSPAQTGKPNSEQSVLRFMQCLISDSESLRDTNPNPNPSTTPNPNSESQGKLSKLDE